jgi:hypothetical protein
VPRFLRRLLRRLLVVVLVLGLLGLGLFTWLCYWPLEGKQGRVEDLVPAGAEFLVSARLDEIERTGFVQKNAFDDPVVPQVKDLVERQLKPLLDNLALEETRINAQIPLGLTTFSIREDLLSGEIVAAGRWCRDLGPPHPPSWREAMLLLRVSWKVRAALAALDHGFVRDEVKGSSGMDISPSEEAGVLKVVLPNVRVSDVRSRSGCGDGFVIPPENVVYLARVRDVLVVGNSLALVARAVDLGRSGTIDESFSSRPGFSLEAPEGSIRAAIDMSNLQPYLTKLMDAGGSQSRLVKYFLGIEALDRMVGHVALASPDLLAGRSTIRLSSRGLMDTVRENYARDGLDLRDGGLASFLPSADTFAVTHLRTDALHLLNAVYDGVLSPQERRLWADNLRESGLYPTLETFFRDVATRLGDEFTISLGRLSTLYDAARFPTFDSNNDKERPHDAEPGLAVLVTLRQGAKPEEVDEFLAKRVHLMAFSKEIEKATYKGFTYSKLKFERGQDAAELQLYRPAYILIQDKLLIASHEDYFKKVLDTFADARANPPLSADATYRVTMEALPPKGHLAFYLDAEKLTRVPDAPAGKGDDADPPGGPRGFLWDRRNLWVWQEKDPRQKAIELRAEITKRYGGAQLTDQQYEAVQNEVSLRKQAWMERYPEFLEEYRNHLRSLRRVRSAGCVVHARGEQLAAEVVVLLRARDAAPGS